MMPIIQLHWLCEQPTPYNDYLFRSIAAELEVDFTVHFVQPFLASHPWKELFGTGFQSRTFHRSLGIDWHVIRQAMASKDVFFVVGGWHISTQWLLMELLAANNKPFAIWTDMPNVTRKRSPVKAQLRSRYLARLFRQANYVMGTGTAALDILVDMDCPVDKLVNFPYFVDIEPSVPGYTHLFDSGSSTCLKLVSVGRFVNSLKAHDQAIKAISLVRDRMKSFDIQYLLVGAGEDQTKLLELISQFELQDCVKVVGWLEPHDVRQLLAASDILLHPSLQEPYGVAILEAMAESAAVIASDACGAALDRIQNYQNGCIFEAGNVEALAQQIEYLATHRDRMAAIKAAARCTALQWPVDKGVETISTMLSEVFGRKCVMHSNDVARHQAPVYPVNA